MTKADFAARLATGVDAVEICTGAYVDQFIGLKIRNAREPEIHLARGKNKKSPSATIGAPPRSDRSGASGLSNNGDNLVSNRNSESESKTLDPEKFGQALKDYVKKRTSREIVDGLAERSPELLAHFVAQQK
jgi:hypothetical protein